MKIKEYPSGWWRFYQYFNIFDFIGLLLVILFSYWGYVLVQIQPEPENFDWASVVFGLVPVVPLTALWFIERKKRWINNLPTYLTVILQNHNQEKVGQVEFIPIQNNSDLRAQAQTVLKTLNNGENLPLELFIRHENISSQVIKDPFNQDKPCELKTVTINQTEPLQQEDNTPCLQNLPSDSILSWEPLKNETKPKYQKKSEENT